MAKCDAVVSPAEADFSVVRNSAASHRCALHLVCPLMQCIYLGLSETRRVHSGIDLGDNGKPAADSSPLSPAASNRQHFLHGEMTDLLWALIMSGVRPDPEWIRAYMAASLAVLQVRRWSVDRTRCVYPDPPSQPPRPVPQPQSACSRADDVGPSVGADACCTTLSALSSLVASTAEGAENDGGDGDDEAAPPSLAFTPSQSWIEAALECSARFVMGEGRAGLRNICVCYSRGAIWALKTRACRRCPRAGRPLQIPPLSPAPVPASHKVPGSCGS